jgi:Glycosyl hydrolases family 16
VPTRCAVRLLAALSAAVALVACGAGGSPDIAPQRTAASVATPAVPGPDNCPTTAAARLGWGAPTRASEFDAGLPPDWHPYGPEVGHDEKGVRTPQAITVVDGAATISATADGTTGAMSWHPGQRYGRWEACVRMDRGPDALHGVLILWPVAEDFPAGGEIDWMEIFRGDRQEATVNIHHGPPDTSFGGAVEHDATQWTAWAVEWTPQHITTYRDGEQWYSTRRADLFPPRPMNMTMQLDWFPPEGGGPASSGSAMHLDWARQWTLPQTQPATLSLGPGDPATGQPRTYPDRKPRPLAAGP